MSPPNEPRPPANGGPGKDSLGSDLQPDSTPTEGAVLDGAGLLDEVVAVLRRYVVLPSPAAVFAAALWIAATHAQPVLLHASRLVAKSPVKRSGKTRFLEVIRELVHLPVASTNISPAALVRCISLDEPSTLIIDEADSVFRRGRDLCDSADALRGILNAGHSRNWPYLRWDPASKRLEQCPTFGMAAVAMIGDAPDTIEDRAIVIQMQRRGADEPVAPFRQRTIPLLHDLRDRLHEWVRRGMDAIGEAEPDLPVTDRAADVWEPLAAVADLAGGQWPATARWACAHVCAEVEDDEATAGEKALADLLQVWPPGQEQVPTADLLALLHDLDESPWQEWYGHPLNARNLARLLRPFAVRSRNIRIGETVAKGYRRDDLTQAWTRYVRYTATDGLKPPGIPCDATESDVAQAVADGADVDATQNATPASGPDLDERFPCSGVAAVAVPPLGPAQGNGELGGSLAAVLDIFPGAVVEVGR